MTRSLDDYLVVSDLDHTLLTDTGRLPQVNLDMIRLFCMRGGRFSVVTGRGVAATRAVFGDASFLKTCICCGGSIIYDFAKAEQIQRHVFDHAQALAALQEATERFPKIGTVVQVDNGEMHVIRSHRCLAAQISSQKVGAVYEQLEDVQEPWVRAAFYAASGEIDMLENWAEAQRNYAAVRFMRVGDTCVEMLPGDVSFAFGFDTLRKATDERMCKIVMIGSTSADISCMKAADYAVASADAPGKVKLAANMVTQISAGEGAVAECLYRLVREHEKRT